MSQADARPEGDAVLDALSAQRLAGLTLRTRRAVEGLLSGIHRSPHRGASVVFVEHRDYRPGDDLRLLDWRAFARTDRHSIKRFEQETQLRAMLLLDRSGSMAWGGLGEGRGARKDDHSATLLAALAYVLIHQGDAVGFAGFDDALHDDGLPPRSRPNHLDAVMRGLARPIGAPRQTNLEAALAAVSERATRPGLIALASDLLDFRPEALHPLRLLATRGHELVVFHVLHRDEIELPTAEAGRFVGAEGEAPVEADPERVAAAYRAAMADFIETCRQRCTAAGARYVLAPTDVPVEHSLAQLLRLGSHRSHWRG